MKDEKTPLLPVAGQIEPPLGPGMPSTSGADFLTTRLDALVQWAHSNSLWPMPFGTACCAIEFMSTVSSHYDLSRFGAEVVRFTPRQADLMLVAGTVTDKLAPVLRKIYDQMPEPKWVVSMGVCACTGGFYRAYHVVQGVDEIVRHREAKTFVPVRVGTDPVVQIPAYSRAVMAPGRPGHPSLPVMPAHAEDPVVPAGKEGRR